MTNQEIIQSFYKVVLDKNGKISSSRLRESYWIGIGLGSVYTTTLKETSFLPDSSSLRLRIVALERGLSEHPKCVSCGNPVMIINNKSFSKYCCKSCVYKDPLISSMRIDSALKVDKGVADAKRKETMIKKYGVEYNSQRKDVKDILSQSKIKFSNPIALSKLQSKSWLEEEYVTKKRSLVDIGEELNVYYGTVGDYLRQYGFEIRQNSNYSIHEVDIGRYIESLGLSFTSDRTVLDGLEIDIFVKDKMFGIELDGAYWHSFNRFESTEEKRKSINKTLLSIDKGVNLMHIFDTEWITKTPIVKSMIAGRLGSGNKIYARKCSVGFVESIESRRFIMDTHIQGYSAGKVNLGLFYDGVLVMIMTFGKPRFNRKYTWELIRMSTALNTTVVGGASKLFKFFLNNFEVGDGVICYSDRRFGEGGVYTQIGFEKVGATSPGYFWTDGNQIWSRTKFQKKKLHRLLPNFDFNLSEAENMFNNKYRRLWDCGSNIFVYKYLSTEIKR